MRLPKLSIFTRGRSLTLLLNSAGLLCHTIANRVGQLGEREKTLVWV